MKPTEGLPLPEWRWRRMDEEGIDKSLGQGERGEEEERGNFGWHINEKYVHEVE